MISMTEVNFTSVNRVPFIIRTISVQFIFFRIFKKRSNKFFDFIFRAVLLREKFDAFCRCVEKYLY